MAMFQQFMGGQGGGPLLSTLLQNMGQGCNFNEGPAPQAPQPSGDKPVHKNIICDACNRRNIQGVRYKCAECRDFDLCEDCEAAGHHSQHVFLKVKVPQGIDIVHSARTNVQEEQKEPVEIPIDVPHMDLGKIMGAINKACPKQGSGEKPNIHSMMNNFMQAMKEENEPSEPTEASEREEKPQRLTK